MEKLVVLTGSGISAESGLKTFREMGGLWEQYDVHEVASPQGWASDMELVCRFYNERRKQLVEATPNRGHVELAELEDYFDVQIITQNVDNLHERAGSTNVLHLHGEIMKARSTGDPSLIYELKSWELNPGDKCEKGYQLRPHVVWFGEPVTLMEAAISITSKADIFAVIGTSLVVYPAASLIDYVPANVPIYLIDPNDIPVPQYRQVEFIREKASIGVPILKKNLLEEYY
ncbi:MAG: NAD-dependent deacetylase [Bacteroides sp. SM23_62_1]|nr:MAG: NAD-dependent deacetylase [Bacteroides sp. SM23_62_1]